MRKISLLLVVLLLFGGVAFASDVTVSGALDFAWGFEDGEYKGDGNQRVDVKVDAQVDQFNSVTVMFRYNGVADAPAPVFQDAFVATDLGGLLALDGIALSMKTGRFEATDFDVGKVTGVGLERGFRVNRRDEQIQLDMGVDALSLRLVVNPGASVPEDSDAEDFDMLVAASFDAGPAVVGFSYTDYGVESGDGLLRFGVGSSLPVAPGVDLSLGANYVYSLGWEEGAWGAGAVAGLMDGFAKVGAGFQGDEDDAVSALNLEVGIMPEDFFGLDLMVSFDLSDDAEEEFSYLETSAWVKAGAATFRLGMAMAGENENLIGTDRNSSGLVAAKEETLLFFRTTISF